MDLVEPDTLERAIWTQASGSRLSRHGACCDCARGWIVAMARSHDFAATDGLDYAAPRWLTRRWRWGPTRWPIGWCDAVRAEIIDCGVFAAFALEIFRAKGVDAYPGQVLRTDVEESTVHWRHKWAAMPDAFNWIGRTAVYHEVCVVRAGPADARIYDPTSGFWLDPGVQRGHHALTAVRAEIPEALAWGPHRLVNGQWTEILAHG